MIDRSQFIDELRRNPELLHRLAVINYGEVGRATVEKQMLQLETVFNRAIARGQTLDEVTQMNTGPNSKGYYPASTFQNGRAGLEKNPGFMDAFREKVFRPVLDGSDVSTRKLGFAATGNASDAGKDRFGLPYASGRQARNEYARTRWYDGGEKTGGRHDEMYVQEKGRLDKNERLDALRKGGPEPQPDPNAPAAPAAEPRSTGNLLADHVAGTPWEPTPEQQSALVTGVPSTQSTPAPTATPAPARTQTQSARAPAAAPRAAAPAAKGEPYDYIDPNTGHRIVNPKGSGEQAMGLTRDIGPPPKAAPARAAAPAAAAKPAEEFSPRSVTSDLPQRTSPPEQVARPDERSSVAPFDQSAMDPTLLPQQRYIDMGPYKDEGPTPPGAITGAPGAAAVAAMAPPQTDFLTTLFQNLSRTPDRPLSTPPATAAPTEPFAPGARSAPFPFAPAQRGPLDAPPPNDASLLPRGLQDPSAASAFGGTRPLDMSPPRTVSQQLTSPAASATPSPSPSLLPPGLRPSEQFIRATNPAEADAAMERSRTDWAPIGKGAEAGGLSPGGLKVAGDYNYNPDVEAWRYDTLKKLDEMMAPRPSETPAGTSNVDPFTAEMQRLQGEIRNPPFDSRLYPQPSSPNAAIAPRGQDITGSGMPPNVMNSIRSQNDPSRDPFFPLQKPMGGYPEPTRPRLDSMAGLAPRGMDPLAGGQMPPASGSATQPTPQQAAMQTLAADPQRDPQSFDTAMQGNLSPFQEWPPPWWGDGYGGGGGFDFGGGGDWGGGSYGGEGFANYGDFSLGNYG